jgi:RNase H-fold protein (predicted Holliday junction resolvase)
VAAQKTMLDMGLSPSRKKGMVDRIAAIHILQSYLDSRRNNDGRRT